MNVGVVQVMSKAKKLTEESLSELVRTAWSDFTYDSVVRIEEGQDFYVALLDGR